MELDHLTEQEVQTAMAAIAQIIPALDLQECLRIVQWATERAAAIQIAPPLASVTTAVATSPLTLLDPEVNHLADELEEELPPMLQLDPEPMDLEPPSLDRPNFDRPFELEIVPPIIAAPNQTNFLVPTLELVGEPPEDLPLAM